VSSPRVNILTVNPFDFRNDAMYPREIGVEAGAKGFISIRRMFTVEDLIGDRQVKVKKKQAQQQFLPLGNSCDFGIVMQ
jgi:hypothetical protein